MKNSKSLLFKSLIAIICMAVLVLVPKTVSNCAEEKGSITATFAANDGKDPLAYVDVTIYKVAEYDANFVPTILADYEGLSVDIPNAGKKEEALKAWEYIVSKGLTGQTEKTDANGTVKFTDLPLGLYLVAQTGDNKNFSVTDPFYISIPSKDGDNYIYDMNATPKISIEAFTDISVRKVWNDDNSAERPKNITAALQRNGVTYEEVVLSADNSWSYTWTGLAKTDEWSVIEVNVPEGYIATYKQDAYLFIIENTPKLVQTGQLKWPVPVLATLGVFLVLLGIGLGRKKDEA